MALQVWLPLRGDAHNQGLTNLNFSVLSTNTTVNSSGKIGQCYQNNSFTAGGMVSDAKISLGQNQSMFCWFKFTTLNSSSSLGGGLVTQHRHGNNAGMGITIKYVSSTTGYLSVNTGNGSSRTYNQYCGTTLLQANKWYHGGYTYDGQNIRIYVNGVLEKTQAYSGMLVPEEFIGVFCWSFDGNGPYGGYKLNGFINDVRVYNHCLSQKEVKEISKGLVQHFKLDDSYGLTNMANGKTFNVYNNYGTGMTSTRQILSETYMGQAVERFTYTIVNSSCASGFKSGYSSRGVYCGTYYFGTSGSNIPFVYWVYCRPQTSGLTAGGTASNIGGWTEIPKEYVGDGWWRVGQKRTNNTSTRLTSDNVFTSLNWPYAGVGSSCTIDFTVAGYLLSGTTEIVENFVEGNSSVYDCSGYRNDGVIYGKPKQTQNTPRYEAATITSTNNCINAGRGGMVKDEITVSVWASMNSWGNYSTRIVSCTEGGGWNFEPSNGKMNFAMGTGASSNTYKNATSNRTLASLSDGWHHFVGTYDGLSTKIYIDGVLEGTNNAYTTKTPIFYANNSVFIGAEAAASQTVPNGSYFAGAISDFRIYGTALSAEDIAELYHTGASVDNKGNFFCGEIKEE